MTWSDLALSTRRPAREFNAGRARLLGVFDAERNQETPPAHPPDVGAAFGSHWGPTGRNAQVRDPGRIPHQYALDPIPGPSGSPEVLRAYEQAVRALGVELPPGSPYHPANLTRSAETRGRVARAFDRLLAEAVGELEALGAGPAPGQTRSAWLADLAEEPQGPGVSGWQALQRQARLAARVLRAAESTAAEYCGPRMAQARERRTRRRQTVRCGPRRAYRTRGEARRGWRPYARRLKARLTARLEQAAATEAMRVLAATWEWASLCALVGLDPRNPSSVPEALHRLRVEERTARWRRRAWQALGRSARVTGCGLELAAVAATADGALLCQGGRSRLKPATSVMNRNRCELSSCPCCSRRQAARRVIALEKRLRTDLSSPRQLVLATFTQEARPGETLRAASARATRRLKSLRRSKEWQARVRSAVVRLEATWSTPSSRSAAAARLRGQLREELGPLDREVEVHNARIERQLRALAESGPGSWWHVHAHMLLRTVEERPAGGSWWEHKAALELWRSTTPEGTGGVNLQTPRGGLMEVVKYPLKAADIGRLDDDNRLVEFVRWQTSTRTLAVWGEWYGVQGLRQELEGLTPTDEEDELDGDAVARADPRDFVGWDSSTGRLVRKRDVVWRTDPASVARALVMQALRMEWQRDIDRRSPREPIDYQARERAAEAALAASSARAGLSPYELVPGLVQKHRAEVRGTECPK